jgi:hypothetical protein
MQIIILFFFFLLSSLHATTCSPQSIKKSDQLYTQANEEENQKIQIELLKGSLDACYAPEIKASLFMLKAETTKDVHDQIEYHMEVLALLSDFDNVKKAIHFQNICNLQLANLYAPIDKETSDDYRRRVYKEEKPTEESNRSIYIFYTILALLIFYAFVPFFQKKRGKPTSNLV